jgi:class 3 adenylate cyclase
MGRAYDMMPRSERETRLAEAWPAAVADYLNRLSHEHLRPAFLQVDADGNVTSAGGALEVYGLSAVQAGTPVIDYLPLLMGLLPMQAPGEPFLVPWVNIDGGGYMDVHLLPGDGCDFVVCIEALVERQERVAWQQKGNELALTKQKQAQLLESHVGKYVADELLRGGLVPHEEGERREASLLFCDIRGFTTFAERQPPQVVFQTLNQLLQAMVQPILEHGGWLDKMAGDAVFGAFGLIPCELPNGDGLKTAAPIRALLAAQEIMRRLRDWNDERRRNGADPLGAGIGITTGPVSVGVLGTRERRQFTIIGHYVNLAARLQTQALAGEIIVDGSTHETLGELAQGFVPRPLQLKGLQDLVTAYVLAGNW